MLKIVIDTNVVVSSMISKAGNPAKIMKLFFERQVELYYSEDIMLEYEDVLFRAHFRFNAGDIELLFGTIKEIGVLVKPDMSSAEMPDEDDRVFYDAAKAGEAFLVTGNKKHYPDEPFILTPAEFLERFSGYSM
jgi:putative PIN family toxin of toxin-antitoxin system